MLGVSRNLYRTCLLAALAATVFNAGCNKKPISAPAPTTRAEAPTPRPTITFQADPTSVNKGESSTLSWSTTNADSWVYINNVGYVGGSGATGVNPSATTDYSCTAQGSGGSDGAHAATLTVYRRCSLPWGGTIAHSQSATAYQASTVPYGSTCVSQSRSCSDSTLSGTYQYGSCSVAAASSCTFNGTTVNHGSSVIAYQSASVPYGSTCVSQTRGCSNGTLSGTYAYSSCVVNPPPPPTCTLAPSQTIVAGSAAALSYTISGLVTSATINGSAVAPTATGTYTPAPPSTTSYTMTVSNSGGSNTCGPAVVTVNAPVGSGIPITGYAWSETIGWISLSGTTYGLLIGSGGLLNGYAWSENIGWVSANTSDLAGCPSAPCSATVSHGTLTGWLRAISADSSWDGWISLNGSNYGVTLSGGSFSGYAWGSDVPGWIDFSNARTVYAQCGAFYGCSGTNVIYSDTDCNVSTVATCVSPQMCSPGVPTCQVPPVTFVPGVGGITTGHLQVKPQVVRSGTSAKAYWNVSNVTSCSVVGSNGDSWSTILSGTLGKATTPITQRTTYTLRCTGLDGSAINETQVVNVTPVFQER